MDSLVDSILELESMTETISANDRRFIAVDDTDAFVQAQQNENTRRILAHPVDKIDRLGRHQPSATASG